MYLGNIGSGKTLSAVIDMVQNKQHITYYANIIPKLPKKTPQIKVIEPHMIIKKDIVGTKKKRGGKEEPVYEYKLNKEFWEEFKGQSKTIVLDEVHNLLNARRPGSRVNVIMGDFLALARRIVGDDPQSEGDLILITQLGRRADVIARDMAHKVVYHIMHYVKSCDKCHAAWRETSEMPEQAKICPYCGHYKLSKSKFMIEKFHFAGINAFDMWKNFGMSSFHMHYYMRNVDKYFKYYSTLQWENLLSDLY